MARVSWPVVLQITASEAPERSPEAFSKAFQQGRGESSGSRPPKSCGQTSQRWHMLFYERLVKPCWGRRSSRAARSRSAAPGAARKACCESHGTSLISVIFGRYFRRKSLGGAPLRQTTAATLWNFTPLWAPKSSQIPPDCPKIASRRRKIAPRRSKIAPRSPKTPPRSLPDAPRWP